VENTGKATVSDDLGFVQCLVWDAQGHSRLETYTSVGWASERDENYVVSKRSELVVSNWNHVCVMF